MALSAQLAQDHIVAYKAKDSLQFGVLRLLKTAAKNFQVELMRSGADEEFAALVQEQAGRRRNFIGRCLSADRPNIDVDGADELVVSQSSPPASLPAAELGVTDTSGMGEVVRSVMDGCKRRADGTCVSAMVKARLF